jgi:IS30 family transposase
MLTNIRRLLLQHFPKGMRLASLAQADLDIVATSLNTRPRKTLGYDMPHERFTHLPANLASSNTPNPGARSGC